MFTPAERRAHLEDGRRLLDATIACREEQDGFHLTLAGMPADAIAQWAADERRCCPFFEFRTAHGPDDALVLHITGPAAAKEILRPELERRGLLTSATADQASAGPAGPAQPTGARPRYRKDHRERRAADAHVRRHGAA